MPNERAWIGAIIGQLSWLARQLRADLLYGCSRIQQLAGANDPEALLELKILVDRAREPHFHVFKHLGCHINDLVVLAVSDASFGGMPKGRSQGGMVVLMGQPEDHGRRSQRECPGFSLWPVEEGGQIFVGCGGVSSGYGNGRS